MLTEEMQKKIHDRFDKLEEEVIGLEKLEELYKILKKMSAVYLN